MKFYSVAYLAKAAPILGNVKVQTKFEKKVLSLNKGSISNVNVLWIESDMDEFLLIFCLDFLKNEPLQVSETFLNFAFETEFYSGPFLNLVAPGAQELTLSEAFDLVKEFYLIKLNLSKENHY